MAGNGQRHARHIIKSAARFYLRQFRDGVSCEQANKLHRAEESFVENF
jgi:hypothetical protein